MSQGFFKRTKDGSIILTSRSKKHPGKSFEEIARIDPGYLRWVWREQTTGVPDILEKIGEVMTSFGISFTQSKKGASPKKKR